MNKYLKLIKIAIAAAIVSPLIPFLGNAVEIPLGGSVIMQGEVKESAGKYAAVGIAYVDIEMIFNEHPMTQRLKSDFETAVANRKKELADMTTQIADMKRIMVSSTTEIDLLKNHVELMKKALNEKPPEPTVVVLPGTTNTITIMPQISSSTVKGDPVLIVSEEKQIAALESGTEQMKTDLLKKSDEVERYRKKIKEEIVALEETNTQRVLNDIYKMLEKIAVEENLTIVVDKSNVLYGQASQDLTEKLRDRMRGR